MTRLCVVGAGAAGAGVADALRERDIEVTILERDAEVSGRAATRRHRGRLYDPGANYVADDDGRTADLVHALGTEGLVDITEPIWTFDAAGEIEAGDPDRQAAHKWTWERGVAQFVERLLDRSDATVRTGTRVDALAREEGAWRLTDADGGAYGPFDAVVLTPPAPTTADLLDRTEGVDGIEPIRAAIGDVPYRTVRSFALGYDFRLDRPWYALVDREKTHPIGWLAREECKRGHVPDGESLLIVQMSPAWSSERFDAPADRAAADVAGRVADLLGDERLGDPAWVDDRRWRHALPDDGVPRDVVGGTRDAGLLFAGDWVAGDGRVHAAFRSGVAVGEAVPDVA